MYDYNLIPDVEEITEINASPVWKDPANVDEKNPDCFIVTMYKAGWHTAPQKKKEFFEIWGEYNLDGTADTYKKAVENYNRICNQLLEKGFVRSSDFENFDWN